MIYCYRSSLLFAVNFEAVVVMLWLMSVDKCFFFERFLIMATTSVLIAGGSFSVTSR